MKIGFGTQPWLRDNHWNNFHRMLDEMSMVRLDGFEMCYPFLVDSYERRPAELRRLLAIHDLELATYYTGVTFHDPDLRERGISEVRRRCRFAAEVGCEFVLLDGGRRRPGATPAKLDDQIKTIAEHANALGEYAASCGLTMAWHQHWGSIFDLEESFHRLMELTDPDVIGFCPDVGQLVLSGFDPVEILRRYGERVAFVHYKDVTFDGRPMGELWPGGPSVPSDDGAYGVDSRGRWVELGRGVVDFPSITAVLRSFHYDDWIVDDFDYTCYPARVSAKACKDYINEALDIWGEKDVRPSQACRET